MLDLNEWALVVAVRPWGHSELLTTNLNPADCAVALRDLAHVFEVVAGELHGTQPEPDQDEAHEPAPVEQPLVARGGRLDRERRTWTDDGGHVWDLSLTWADAVGNEWRWTGSLDRSGTPTMVGGAGDCMPLDVVRVLLGPIAPCRGEGA